MVAYSFQKRFAEPILAGTKSQTIRADRKRHARPGEELQLYTGMRTKHCRLIARVQCIGIRPITLDLAEDMPDAFAHRDGFADWEDMRAFWRQFHPGVETFTGVLILWDPILTGSAVFPEPT
jgi:uncharacterized protein YqfB (UPF0267 family)